MNNPANHPKAPGGQHEGMQLEICVSCPQCGGENRWGLLECMNRCSFCDSALYWPMSEKGETYLVTEDKLASDGAIVKALATVEAIKARSALIGQLTARVDESRLEMAQADAEEKVPSIQELVRQILPAIRVSQSVALHAPYRVLQITLAFHVLGRVSGSRKAYKTLFFLLEDVLPAYDKAFNFRDQGLWLSKTTLRPLTAEMLAAGLFLVPSHDDLDRQEILRRYLRRTDLLKADMDPISFESEAVVWKEWLVFRPFHLVLAQTPSEAGWFLLDGQFGTIAGRPDPVEADFLSSDSWTRLDLKDVRQPGVRVIPFRCPQCGSDLALDSSALYQLCRECGRLLRPTSDGLKPFGYQTLEPSDVPWTQWVRAPHTAWLPFWAVRLEWSAQGQTGKDPLGLAPLFLGTRPGSVPEAPSGGRLLYVPAFDSWTYDDYDDWSFEAASDLSSSAAEPADARLMVQASVGEGDTVIPAVVDQQAVRALFPKTLPAFFPVEAQVKLNPMVLERLFKGSFSIQALELVYVPVACSEATGGEDQLMGPRVPIGLAMLKDRSWPPILCRTVRRRLEMGKQTD